jgi:HlyD family secretion protein
MTTQFSRSALITFILFSLLTVTACSANTATEMPVATTEALSTVRKTTAEGKVLPIKRAILGFPVAGTVESVLIEEGSLVYAGDLIATLSGIEKAKAEIARAEVQLLTAQKNLSDLIENAPVVTASTELELAQARLAYEDALDARNRMGPASTSQLNSAEAEYILAKQAFEDADNLYGYFVDLDESDPQRATALKNLADSQIRLDRASRNLNYARTGPDSFQIAETDSQVFLEEARLKDAERRYDRLKDGPDREELEIAQAGVTQAEAALAAGKSALADLEIRAPFNGTMVANDLRVGEVAIPGAGVALGDLSAWIVETSDLREVDIVGIRPGMPIAMTLEAIPGLELPGSVKEINMLGENKQGDIVYKVIIQLSEQDPRLMWNMTVNAAFIKD